MTNHTYTGFQTWIHNIRMSLRMNLIIFAFLTVIYCAVIITYLFLSYSPEFLKIMAQWLVAKLLVSAHLYKFPFNVVHDGDLYQLNAAELYEQFYNSGVYHLAMIKAFSIKALLAYLLYLPIQVFFRNKAGEHSEDDYERGAKIIEPSALNKQTRKEKRHLEFGEAKMPVSAEIKHIFVIGRTGAGKTLLTNNIVDKIRQRGDRAVIYDYKGDYISRFFDPATDLLFNPLDSRSVCWNIFADMHTPMDIASMVASLIPEMRNSNQPFFNMAARDVFAGIISNMFQENQKNYAALWTAITTSPKYLSDILIQTKGGVVGGTHISDSANKQTLSIMSTMLQYTKIFEYFQDSPSTFSIEKWIKSGSEILFISNYDKLKETLRPILTMFIDTLATNLLSMPDDENRRIFFILDEFGTLQKMQKIVELLTLSRSKGGAVYLGIQDVGQIDNIYGRELRNSIVNACGTNAIFGVNDPDTADFLSRKIGEAEYKLARQGYTVGAAENRTAVSLSKQTIKESLFLPSELMQFPDLQCYVKFPNYSGCVTALKRKSYPVGQYPFLMRSDLSLEHIYRNEKEISESLETGLNLNIFK